MKSTCVKYVAAAMMLFAVATSARADFAAIAYSPSTGSWGYAAGYGSRSDAEVIAKSRCQGADARPVVWVQNGWAALAIGDNGVRGWGWSGSSLAEAKKLAIQNAGANATVRCWVYSGR
ncbi:MAG TPA: DUF4189 domain-containing protein [Gemmataceae bacterium]|jgi:serine/threonine-protein kinase|nr:DUF4189 domain-containing protein [Gemmataceae bacterium]